MAAALIRTKWRKSLNFNAIIDNSKKCLFYSSENLKLVEIQAQDNLQAKLRDANTTGNILKIINENRKLMNEKQNIFALKCIFHLAKTGKTDMSPEKLIKHPEIERICQNIKKYSGIIELNDAVDCLKSLVYVGTPTKSTIVQILLQIIRGNINSLSIPQILFLDFLLTSFERTPLVEAFQLALPLIFDISVKTRLNTTNIYQIAECFHYAVKNNLSDETINFLLKTIENYPNEFDKSAARNIINTICLLPRNDRFEMIIKRATTDLIVNQDEDSIIKMEITLTRLVHKYTSKYRFYYQEVLCDTLANYIIDKKVNYKRAIALGRTFTRFQHFHPGLLDYIAEEIYHKSETIEKNPVDIYSICVYAALTNYRPKYWEHLKKWIKSARNLAEENYKEIIWIRFATALCMLDIYKIDILTRALIPDYLHKLLVEKHYQSNLENYFLIYQCLKHYKPDLVELLPENLDTNNLVLKLKNYDGFPLKGALESGLGGEEFLLTNLYSKLGVHIDHALIFNNGAPVNVSKYSNVEFLEDLNLKSSDQLVLIWRGIYAHYTVNTNSLRAVAEKSLEILADTLKCPIICINTDSWELLEDFEKIPYLMQQINEKLDKTVQFETTTSSSII